MKLALCVAVGLLAACGPDGKRVTVLHVEDETTGPVTPTVPGAEELTFAESLIEEDAPRAVHVGVHDAPDGAAAPDPHPVAPLVGVHAASRSSSRTGKRCRTNGKSRSWKAWS